jgi:threonine aldolase
MNLASDNVVGMSPPVLEVLIAANRGAEAAYGTDSWTVRAERMLADVFEHEVSVFLLATGTAANALALAALSPPWGAVFCHVESHVMEDECGAPEMFSDGAKLIGVPGVGGKFTPADLEARMTGYVPGVVKSVQPAALSISQVTEAGTLYSLEEIRALAALARSKGLGVHLDGARFANAMVALGCSAADMTWKSGVDVVSFGATKNGALACEAVVFFDKARAQNFQYRRKRSGHTLSKGRLLGAQMVGYLENGHWIDNARHANAAAARLAAGLAAIPGVRLPWSTQANEIFVVVPERVASAFTAEGIRAAPWGSDCLPADFEIGGQERFLRFVTSFATESSEIDKVLAVAAR